MNQSTRFYTSRRVPDDLLPNEEEKLWVGRLKVKWQDTILRDIAQACCDGFRPNDDEIQCAFNALERAGQQNDWRMQALAAWILGFAPVTPDFQEGTQETVAPLLAYEVQEAIASLLVPKASFLERTAASSQRALRRVLPLTATSGALIGSYSSGTIEGALAGVVLGIGTGYFLFPLFLPVSSFVDRRQGRHVQCAALMTLRRWRDPHFVGATARAAMSGDETLLMQVQATLDVLLPRLTPAHYGTMPAGTTADLCRALDYANEAVLWEYRQSRPYEPYVPLAVSVLHALKLVGSGDAAKTVRSVVEKAHQRDIRRLAKMVLPHLEQREIEETARQTLLRQSHAPNTQAELLRPAASTAAEADVQTLVRPSL